MRRGEERRGKEKIGEEREGGERRMTDSEQLRVAYEGVVKQTPSNVEAVHYLAVWHLERHSFQQVLTREPQPVAVVSEISL